MDVEKFTKYLDEREKEYEWAEGKHEGNLGIFVKNLSYETETHFSNKAIKANELDLLVTQTHQGRNVENITRVTGFFSKVSAWNKGKRGELTDRHRNTDL